MTNTACTGIVRVAARGSADACQARIGRGGLREGGILVLGAGAYRWRDLPGCQTGLPGATA
jgi:hypothetical protein